MTKKLPAATRQPVSAKTASRKKPLLYQVLLGELRAEILRGLYPVATPLPSEQSLMERFKVSRHTVRDALRHLRDLGLVESHQGLGTLVLNAGGPQAYVHQVNDIGELHDYKVDSRYGDHADPVVLTDSLALRLGVKKTTAWLRIDGMRFDQTSAVAMCVVEIYVPTRFSGIGRLLRRRTVPIYALIEAVYGESVGEVHQDLRAVPATPKIAAALKLQPAQMLVEIKRVYRLTSGEVAEITFNYYRASTFTFSMKLRRVRGVA